MIVIDIEIEKAILGKNETPLEGIEYCGGWEHEYAAMAGCCGNCGGRLHIHSDLDGEKPVWLKL